MLKKIGLIRKGGSFYYDAFHLRQTGCASNKQKLWAETASRGVGKLFLFSFEKPAARWGDQRVAK